MTSEAWVRVLAQMTQTERDAIGRYQSDLRRIEREHAGEDRLRRWAGVLRILRESAVGSPIYDRWVDRQQERWSELKVRVDGEAAA